LSPDERKGLLNGKTIQGDASLQSFGTYEDSNSPKYADVEYALNEQRKDATEKAKERRAQIALIGATIFTTVFMFAELAGGYIGNSLAIMTDAAHLLTDVVAMLLSLFAMKFSKKPSDHKMSFGYHRAEIIGASLSIFLIWGLVAILIYEAVLRLYGDIQHGEVVDGKIMTIIGCAGLGVNIIDALILYWGNASHSHSHGHSHGNSGHSHGNSGHSHGHGGGGGSISVRAALAHAIGDCLQSVGVIIAAALVWVGNLYYDVCSTTRHANDDEHDDAEKRCYWNLADPIASLIFGVITLVTTIGLIKQILAVLMEKVPDHIDYNQVKEELRNIDEVTEIHDLHIWSIAMGKVSLSCHLVSTDHVNVLKKAQDICKSFGIIHSTIQVDPSDDCHDGMGDCRY